MKPVDSPLAEAIGAAKTRGRTLFWAAFLFGIFVNLLMLTGPLFMLQVYDRVLSSRSEETLLALFVLVAALFSLMGVLDWARGRIVARIGGRIQETLDGVVFEEGLRRKAMSARPGNHLTPLRDIEAIQAFHGSPVVLALMDLPWSPVFFTIIFIFHPWLGWLALAGALVLVAATLANQVLTSRRVETARQRADGADHASAQSHAGSEVILGLGMQGAMRDRWKAQRRAAMELGFRANDWSGSFSAFAKAFRLFLQSAMLAAGAYLVLLGELTPGAMIAASILLGRSLAPVEQCLGNWALVQRARVAWRSLADLAERTPQSPRRTLLPRPAAKLTVDRVSLVSPNGRGRVLNAVSLSLEPGRALGIIGKSGSGKSTLAKAIVGLVEPSAGEIRLGGPTLDQYDRASLAHHIGYLPQELTLFDGTIAENIARMAERPDDAAVVSAARRAAVHDLITSLEDGYDTYIHGAEPRLSGGQRQRIALARALYGDPVLLVLDEPNSALDDEGTNALNSVVRDFKASGRSVIIMTHRPLAIRECDDLAVVEAGKVTAYGPRDEVLEAMVRNAGSVRRSLEKVRG